MAGSEQTKTAADRNSAVTSSDIHLIKWPLFEVFGFYLLSF
jgi:hypothetical protein